MAHLRGEKDISMSPIKLKQELFVQVTFEIDPAKSFFFFNSVLYKYKEYSLTC